jgi:hypothetical protein
LGTSFLAARGKTPWRTRAFLQLLGRFREENASILQHLNLVRNTPRNIVPASPQHIHASAVARARAAKSGAGMANQALMSLSAF